MENPRELIEKALSKERVAVTPEQLRLDSYRMTSQTDVPEEEFLFRHFGKPCFPRKELTTVTGPAKSGKTFFTSMLMACCIRRQVMTLERVREEPLKVMWYDTEQSRNTTKEILVKRIGRMVSNGDSTDTDDTDDTDNAIEPDKNFTDDTDDAAGVFPDEQFFVFNMRGASIQERRELLAVAIASYRPDLVILDGISDLLADINDGPRATELIEELLQLANEHNCNITTVIHLNRTGEKSNLRGWLGSVMLQKSFEVFNCAQVSQTETFSVEQSLSRKWRCLQTLYYEIDDEGIPQSAQKPDLQPRDAQGKFTSKDIGTLNSDYIIRHPDSQDKPWEWDLRRLFTDAMGGLPSMGNEQMEQAVMKLSHIRQKQYYYKVLAEAEQQGIISKGYDRYKRVAIVLLPPR